MWELIAVFCATLFVYHWWTLRPSRFPPGPPCLPIVGSVPFIAIKRIHFYMEEARKKYGPLVGVKLGMGNSLFVCAPKEVFEIFKTDVFQGRPTKMAISSNKANKGIIATDGPFWSTQRRFTMRHLRDFGFGKTSTEGAILEEIDDFFQQTLFKKEQIQIGNLFNTSAINVLWALIAGKRYQYDDKEFHVLLEALHETFRQGGFGTGSLVFLRRLFRSAMGCPEKIECEGVITDFIQNAIEEHKKDKAEEPRDFIDVYLREIESSENPDFNELTMVSICLDLFTAGAESVGNTLSFCILYLVLHPDEQEAVAKEIEDVLAGNKPNLSDRARLPRVEAFLSEVARINTITPIPIPRRTVADAEYAGYLIPKNTFVVLSMWSVFHDKEHWGDPEVFRPSRFLDDSGQYVKDDWLITFGIGKRQCPGESLARNVMFLFFVRLLQEFKFSLPEGAERPTTLGLPGFTSAPAPFEAKLTRRNT